MMVSMSNDAPDGNDRSLSEVGIRRGPATDECNARSRAGLTDKQWLALAAAMRPRVVSYVRRVVRDQDDVDDLVSETLARAWLDRASLGDDAPIQIIGYAREVCREWVHDHRRATRLASDDVSAPGDGADDSNDANGSMWVAAAVRRREWYKRVVASLPGKQRTAVDFRICWHFSYALVAAVLETSEAAARVDVHRGLRNLRRIVAVDPLPASDDDVREAARHSRMDSV